jgi:NAD(P)-dependent dehydrogenase (short-subunit alcohol dehydrogenase family)
MLGGGLVGPPERNVMHGRVCLITGATSGIGKEAARGLARMGATVIIGARDLRHGEAARSEIAADAPDAAVHLMRLDVAGHASIHAFAGAFSEQFTELHVLVNNAGAWFSERRESPDGYELTFATNALGPHLLTELLLPPLRLAGDARVVNVVSSIAGHYDSTDLQFTRRRYDGYQAYAQSKQALRMLTWALAARLAGTGATANAAAPGFVRTGLNRHAHGFRASMIGLSSRLFAVSPQKGADTPLWVAVAPELDGVTGQYFDQRTRKDGRFADPEPIEELEQLCRQMEHPTPR